MADFDMVMADENEECGVGIMRTQSRFRWVISAVSAVIFHGFRSWFWLGFVGLFI